MGDIYNGDRVDLASPSSPAESKAAHRLTGTETALRHPIDQLVHGYHLSFLIVDLGLHVLTSHIGMRFRVKISFGQHVVMCAEKADG